MKKALEGSTTMLIWLGKQLLGQTDRQSAELTGAGGEPLLPDAVLLSAVGGRRPAAEEEVLTSRRASPREEQSHRLAKCHTNAAPELPHSARGHTYTGEFR